MGLGYLNNVVIIHTQQICTHVTLKLFSYLLTYQYIVKRGYTSEIISK